MPVAELMLAGVELLLLGMGIVFGFLTILVFTLRGMSRLAAVLEHRDQPPATQLGTSLMHPGGDIAQDELIAVITAAVARHRAASRR